MVYKLSAVGSVILLTMGILLGFSPIEAQDNLQETATPNIYEQTATAIIQTATAEADIADSQLVETPIEDYAFTATQLVLEATQTAEAFTGENFESQAGSETSTTETNASDNSTDLSQLLAVFVVGVGAGAAGFALYLWSKSRTTTQLEKHKVDKRKHNDTQ